MDFWVVFEVIFSFIRRLSRCRANVKERLDMEINKELPQNNEGG